MPKSALQGGVAQLRASFNRPLAPGQRRERLSPDPRLCRLVANGRLNLAHTVAVLCAKPQNGAEDTPAAPWGREMRLPLGMEGVFGAQIDPTGRHGGG